MTKAPLHTAFLDLEESLAARLRQSWSRYWSALSADILHLTAQGKFDEAHKLADTLDLAPLFDKARPYARTLGMSALLLGASRITPGIRDSRMAKTPPKRHLDGYLDQLQTMLARNATQALRLMVHEWVTAEEQKLVKWDESEHPRGKTTPESNSGSFAPKGEPVHSEVAAHIQDVLGGATTLRPSFAAVRPKVVFSRRSGVEYDPFDDEMRFPAYGADRPLAEVDREYDSKNPKEYVAGSGIRAYLLHEYAHAIDHYIRRGVTDDDFLTEWQEAKKALRSEVGDPSEYAKKGLNEWVAERFLWEALGKAEPRLTNLLDRFVKLRLSKSEWREEDHPRGKTTPESTPGSFAPKLNWYHGSLTDVLDRILKEGIRPGSETGVRRWGPQFYQDPVRAASVFVASSFPQAEGWAIDAAYNIDMIEVNAGNKDAPLMTPVVLEIEVPREVAEQSVKDSVTYNEFHRMHRGRIPPEWIKGYTIIRLKREGAMGFINVAGREHHQIRKSDNTFYVVVMVRETTPVAKADADRNQVKIMTAGKQYFALAASVQVSRLSAFGFLAEAAERGVKNYRVDAVLDEHTCEVCRHMDGWVFPVDAGFALATQIMETDDPDALKAIAPFYAQNKASLAALATYGTEDFIEEGMSLPPYHPLCRCILTPTEETADVHPTDRSDRVALAAQALYGEGDGVRLTQTLFGVERLPEETDTVAAPETEEDSRIVEMLTGLLHEPTATDEPGFAQSVMGRLLAPTVQPDALVQPTAFEGTTIPSKWVAPFDPKRLAGLAASQWPWLAALLGWMALREPKQQSGFDQYLAEMEEDEEMP